MACYEVVGAQHPLAELASMGRIHDERLEMEPEKRVKLQSLLDERRAACRACFAYWTCAGDCFTRAFLNGVERLGEHSLRCQVNRLLTQYMILSQIEAGGGVWRRQAGVGRLVEGQYLLGARYSHCIKPHPPAPHP